MNKVFLLAVLGLAGLLAAYANADRAARNESSSRLSNSPRKRVWPSSSWTA